MSNAPSNNKQDPFGARATFDTGSGQAYYYRLGRLKELGYDGIDRLPFSIKVLLEAVLRECDGHLVTKEDVEALATYDPAAPAQVRTPTSAQQQERGVPRAGPTPFSRRGQVRTLACRAREAARPLGGYARS